VLLCHLLERLLTPGDGTDDNLNGPPEQPFQIDSNMVDPRAFSRAAARVLGLRQFRSQTAWVCLIPRHTSVTMKPLACEV
jgi:hypothetical protein